LTNGRATSPTTPSGGRARPAGGRLSAGQTRPCGDLPAGQTPPRWRYFFLGYSTWECSMHSSLYSFLIKKSPVADFFFRRKDFSGLLCQLQDKYNTDEAFKSNKFGNTFFGSA